MWGTHLTVTLQWRSWRRTRRPATLIRIEIHLKDNKRFCTVVFNTSRAAAWFNSGVGSSGDFCFLAIVSSF